MQPTNDQAQAVAPRTEAETFADCALRISGPGNGQLEVSIDGAPYKRCRYADGYWWHHWSGSLAGLHHMVVVIRRSPTEPLGGVR